MQHTFVIPAYKNSPFLEECIISLKNQTEESEIIITTSSPSDYIDNISKKYSINYFINTETKGLANDWTFAISKAKTNFVTIAHQDDIYEKTFVENVLNNARNKKNVLITFTDYNDLIDGIVKSNSLNYKIKKILLFPFLVKSTIYNKCFKRIILIFGDPICCPAVTFNMGELKEYKFSNEYDCNPDWYAWLEFSKRKGAFIYINKRLMQHRVHKESATSFRIKNGVREMEEFKIFEYVWGKRIAKFIMWFFTLSHKDNDI